MVYNIINNQIKDYVITHLMRYGEPIGSLLVTNVFIILHDAAVILKLRKSILKQLNSLLMRE